MVIIFLSFGIWLSFCHPTDALIDVFGQQITFLSEERRNHFVFLCSSCKSVRVSDCMLINCLFFAH